MTGSVAVLAPYRRKDGKRDFNLLTVLRSGDSFGELALISNKPRAASIFVRESSNFGVLERHDYHRILGKIQEERLAQKVELLHRHPAFTNWSKTSLQKVSYFFKEQCFKWKQVLCRAGQPADYVFLIKSGDFQLYKAIRVMLPHRIQLKKEAETTLHTAELTLLTIGEMIGDQEAITGKGYSYTVLCASAEGEVLAVSKGDFLQRVVNEESTECLHALSQVKERYRKERVFQLSRLEARKWSSTLPTPLKDFSPRLEKEQIDPLKIKQARSGLEAAVRKRWDLPHRRVGSLALEKAQTTEWLKSPTRSAAGSPKQFSKETGRRSEALILPRKKQHSWLRLVTAKYFSDSGNLGVIFHQLKEPERPQSLDLSHPPRAASCNGGRVMHRQTLITETPVE